MGVNDLLSRYFERVYSFCLRLCGNEHDAQDLTQQTFFQALQKIDTFEGRADPATWLCAIAKNAFYSGKRKKESLPLQENLNEGSREDPLDEIVRQDDLMQLHKKLHELPEPYREVFSLRVLGELHYAQIASLFGKQESWARVTFYRAKCELIKRLKEDETNNGQK